MSSSQRLHEALVGHPAGSREFAEVFAAAVRRYEEGHGDLDACLIAEALTLQREAERRRLVEQGKKWLDGKVVESLLIRVEKLEVWRWGLVGAVLGLFVLLIAVL